MILSHIPGRIRIHLPDPADLSQALTLLEETKGVTAVLPNPRTGSLLVHYDPLALPPEQIPDLLDGVAPAARKISPAGRGRSSSPRMAKRGMVSFLGINLMSALLGQKKVHIATGSLFTLLLGYHLYIYRRRIFL